MYTWEDEYTLESFETDSLRALFYIIHRAYREHASRLPRGVRILKDGQLFWAIWYEGLGAFVDIGHQELPTMRTQTRLANMRLDLLGQCLLLDVKEENDIYTDALRNMPCDTYGMCACTSSCIRYHECYECK